jgi:hypothetical protein
MDSKMKEQTIINNLPFFISLYCLQHFLVFGKAIMLCMNCEMEAQTFNQNLHFYQLLLLATCFGFFKVIIIKLTNINKVM